MVPLARRLHRRVREGERDDERVDAGECGREGRWIGDVGGPDLDVVRERTAGGLTPVRQHDDPMAASMRLGCDRATDEPRSAGYRDDHPGRLVLRTSEHRIEDGSAVGEDLLELAPDDQAIDQVSERPERKLVFDLIGHQGAAVHRAERVVVLPSPVRAAELDVDEPMWRVIGVDPRPPRHRDPQQRSKAVVDHEAGPHRAVLGQELEPHRGRGDAPEIVGVGEELEHVRQRAWDELRGQQSVGGHREPRAGIKRADRVMYKVCIAYAAHPRPSRASPHSVCPSAACFAHTAAQRC